MPFGIAELLVEYEVNIAALWRPKITGVLVTVGIKKRRSIAAGKAPGTSTGTTYILSSAFVPVWGAGTVKRNCASSPERIPESLLVIWTA